MWILKYQHLVKWFALLTIVFLIIVYSGTSMIATSEDFSGYQPKHDETTDTPTNDVHVNRSRNMHSKYMTNTDPQISKEGRRIPFGKMSTKQPSSTFPVAIDNKIKNDSQIQYLFALKGMFGGGANAQYETFKNGMVLSLLTNRSLVMTPFYLHGGHVRGFTAEHMRTFNSTFDVETLRKLMPLATIDQYRQNCNAQNTEVIGWKITNSNYENTSRSLYRDMINIDLPEADRIIDLEYGVKLEELISKTRKIKCLAFTIESPFRLQLAPGQKQDALASIAKYLVRSPHVRQVVDDLSEKICDGKNYMALHWRNKSAEMPCFFRSETHKNECMEIKRDVRKLARLATDAVSDLMKKENIKCLYVACPLWSMEILDILSARIPRENIIISADLDVPEKYKTFMADYYMLSLFEQEIAFRATIFVSAGYSNWSDFVTEGREAIGRRTYDIRKLANIPERFDKKLIR